MARHHKWYSYYWAFIKQTGKECWHTWRGEVLASAITLACVYLINRNSIDMSTGLKAIAYTVSAFVLWHSIRVPWVLYEKLDEADHLKPIWGIAGFIFLVGSFALLIYTSVWFYTMQPKVILGLAPDANNARVAQLEVQVIALQGKIPDERSLKVRSLNAAIEYEHFWRNLPKAPNCTQTNTMTAQEQQKAMEPCLKYDNQMMSEYARTMAPRVMEIVQEFKAKGVDVINIENCAAMGFCGIPLSTQLRAMSERLDGQDHLRR